MIRLNGKSLFALVTVLLATPVLAETANFASLTLSPGFSPAKALVTGSTGGSVSLTSIEPKDSQNRPCIGYGSQSPDHIMVLEKDFSRLKLQVNSKGKDTTLIVKGPNNVVRCGDDTGSTKDASVEDSNWRSGEYKIWIGSINPGQKWNYTLSARE